MPGIVEVFQNVVNLGTLGDELCYVNNTIYLDLYVLDSLVLYSSYCHCKWISVIV